VLDRSLSWQAFVALTLLAACGGPDRAPAADSSRPPAPSATRQLGAAAPRGRTYPGALAKPIDAYSGDELNELTQRLEFTGTHERERRCRGAAGCDGIAPSRRTLVEVGAVATQDSLNVGDIPAFGVVQVRAVNRGDAIEARYGIRPGGALRYYVIVQRDSAGGMRWRLEELDTTPPRRHVQVAAGRVVGCGHPWTPGARADFRTCEQTDTLAATAATRSLVLDAPMWYDCDVGCCTITAQ
jgi:hypothetical protein